MADNTGSGRRADTGHVHLNITDDVAHIVFDRPASRNAISWSMYEQLQAACAAISQKDAIRSVILTGIDDSAFIAGTDIQQFQSFDGRQGVDYEKQVNAIVETLEQLNAVTIARVQGYATGAGLILASACDMRIATPDAQFGMPIARTLGNCLSAANLQRLCQTLGVNIVRRMLLTGEMFPASALPEDYVRVVAASELDAAANEICKEVRRHAPLTLWATKECLRRLQRTGPGRDIDDTDIIDRVYGSTDFREGVHAFLEKRRAHWQGR